MAFTRRDFLKVASGAAGFIILQPWKFAKQVTVNNSPKGLPDIAMLIDVSKCIGCWWCYAACKNYNNLPETIKPEMDEPPELTAHTWTTLFTLNKNGDKWSSRKHACMHCVEASCEQVCPTGAISHQGAAVVVDQDWCIGCGYCVQACPFGVPHKDEDIGTVRKCTFCIGRTSEGEVPACADACPTGAITFGKRAELIDTGKTQVEILKSDGYSKANLYGEHELGGLHILYVLNDEPSVYGLPESPKVATSSGALKWLSGIIAGGVVAAIPFWLLFRKKSKVAQEESSE